MPQMYCFRYKGVINMRYAYIMPNDFIDGEGVCVSLWVQGCPHRCTGCHNSEQWNFEDGKLYTDKVKNYIIEAITKNDIMRNFSILGGEPLCEENIVEVANIILAVRHKFPNIKIFLWTGYTLEELITRYDKTTDAILYNIDYLIDGRFELDKRDITLKLRGSSNQHIYHNNSDRVLELIE